MLRIHLTAEDLLRRVILGQILSLREREFAGAALHLMKKLQWSLLSSGA